MRRPLFGHGFRVSSLCFAAPRAGQSAHAHEVLISGDVGGFIHVWHVQSAQLLCIHKAHSRAAVSALVCTHDRFAERPLAHCDLLISGDVHGNVVLWRWADSLAACALTHVTEAHSELHNSNESADACTGVGGLGAVSTVAAMNTGDESAMSSVAGGSSGVSGVRERRVTCARSQRGTWTRFTVAAKKGPDRHILTLAHSSRVSGVLFAGMKSGLLLLVPERVCVCVCVCCILVCECLLLRAVVFSFWVDVMRK
jgi:hypothetical protein